MKTWLAPNRACALTLAMAVVLSCQPAHVEREPRSSIEASLRSGSVDMIYSVSCFAESYGKRPLPTELPSSRRAWENLADELRAWFRGKSKEERAELDEGYSSYLVGWSPVFSPGNLTGKIDRFPPTGREQVESVFDLSGDAFKPTPLAR